jgi:hypothetical protein
MLHAEISSKSWSLFSLVNFDYLRTLFCKINVNQHFKLWLWSWRSWIKNKLIHLRDRHRLWLNYWFRLLDHNFNRFRYVLSCTHFWLPNFLFWNIWWNCSYYWFYQRRPSSLIFKIPQSYHFVIIDFLPSSL